MNMLTGRFASDGQTPITFHIGANMDQRVSVNIGAMTAANLQVGGETPTSISSVETANQSLGRIDEGNKWL